jgi:CBS domain-containing protein
MRLARESSMLMLEEVTAMKVEDVMTRDVITVGHQSVLKAVAETLAANRISGVPVVEDGRVLGVVSEADILEKEAAESKPSVLGRLLRRDRAGAKKAARTAGEAMTSPAVTVRPQRDVAHAARLMVDRGLNRLPVVNDDHRLVGIVTRADLVRAFVRSDQEIARELREDVVAGTLWMNAEELDIRVEGGEVTLAGEVGQKAHAELLERLAARVPGVVSVRSELRWRIDRPKLPQSDPRVPQPPRHR